MTQNDLVEKVTGQLDRIRKSQKVLNAFVTVLEDTAVLRAEELEKKKASGARLGRLFGMTFAIKDNICVQGVHCTCGSKTLENYVSPYNATVVHKLLEEDAIIIGKVGMDEFASGSGGISGHSGIIRNPHDVDRVPGGSSSGSGVAVASGLADAALGSDTGGSIRCPASFCGVWGLRPSWGTISRFGLCDLSMSMDVIGPMTCGARELSSVFGTIRGPDTLDATTTGIARPAENVDSSFTPDKLKIGIVSEFFPKNLDEEVKTAALDVVSWLESEGATIVETSIPSSDLGIPAYYLCTFSEFASAMQKFDGFRYGHTAIGESVQKETLVSAVSNARRESFGSEVKRRVLLGTYITMKEHASHWYSKALLARQKIKEEINRTFEKDGIDLLVGPVMPKLAWKIGEKNSPLQNYLADILTVQASLAGIPALSAPLAKSRNGLPIGVQFQAKRLNDSLLLELAGFLEGYSGIINQSKKLDGRCGL